MKRTLITAAIMALALPALADETHTPADGWNEGGGEQDEALGLTPDLENGKYVYEICSACHGMNGWGLVDGTFPQIAGQHPNVAIKQLADIRALNRDNPTMYPFALPSEIGGSQSIADVAAYIAALPMNPEPGFGAGDDLEYGAKLYAENCTQCHGAAGEGSNEKFYPLIAGQHYEYLMRQYQWIKEGKRRNANPEMVAQIQWFTERDTKAVLDYVSRLAPPEGMVAESVDWVNPDFDW